jgi:hypothetical protein
MRSLAERQMPNAEPRNVTESAMKRVSIIVGGLVLLIVIVAAIGDVPRTHTASRTLRVRRSPQEAWTAITQAMNTSDVAVDTSRTIRRASWCRR